MGTMLRSRRWRSRMKASRAPELSDEAVVVDVVFESGLLFLELVNLGDRPALDVSCSFEPALVDVQGRNVSEQRLFRGLPCSRPAGGSAPSSAQAPTTPRASRSWCGIRAATARRSAAGSRTTWPHSRSLPSSSEKLERRRRGADSVWMHRDTELSLRLALSLVALLLLFVPLFLWPVGALAFVAVAVARALLGGDHLGELTVAPPDVRALVDRL